MSFHPAPILPGRSSAPAIGAVRSAQERKRALLCSAAVAGALFAMSSSGRAAAACGSPQHASDATSLSGAVDCANNSSTDYSIITDQQIDITGTPLTFTIGSSGGNVTATLTGAPITSTSAAGTPDVTLSQYGTTVLGSTGLTTYSGDTVLNNGTLRTTAVNALSPNSNFNISTATLDLAGNDQTVGSVSGYGNILLGSGTLTTGRTGVSTTFTGLISGSGGVTLDPSAGYTLPVTSDQRNVNFTLTNTNTYTGPTTINVGFLVLQDGGSVAGPIVINASPDNSVGGTLVIAGSSDYPTRTIGNTISGAGGIVIVSSQVTLTGDNADYRGAINLAFNGDSATSLIVGSNTAVGSGSASISLQASTTLDLNGYGVALAHLSDGGTTAQSSEAVTLNGGILTVGASDGRSDTFSGTISDGNISGGSLVKVGSNTILLAGQNTFSGGVTLTGGTVQVNNSTFGYGGGIDSSSIGTGTLTFNGGTLQVASDSGIITLGNAVQVNAPGGTVDNNGQSLRLSGDIAGPGGLTFKDSIGTGMTLLLGSSTYSGATLVASGTLQAGAPAALSSASAFTVASGATLDLGGYDSSIGSLAGAGTVTNVGEGAVSLTTGLNNTSTTFSGLLDDGSGLALIKVGTGTQTLLGANTYAGGTDLRAGAIAVGNNLALGTGTLVMAAGTTLQAVANVTLGNAATLAGTGSRTFDTQGFTLTESGPINGTGQLVKAGTGTLTLSGANSYTGGTVINVGTVAVGDDGALGTGLVSISGGTLEAAVGTGAVTLANAIRIGSAGATIDSNGAQPFELDGAMLDGTLPGTLTLRAGVVNNASEIDIILGGPSTRTGSTVVETNAFVQTTANNATGTGPVLVNGQLGLGANSLTISNLTGSGEIFADGFRAGTRVATTLNVASGDFSGILENGFSNEGATNFTGNLAIAKVSDGSASGGTLTLSGDNTYSGGTQLRAGTIVVGSDTALGVGLLSMSNGTTLKETVGVTLANAAVLSGTDTFETSDTVGQGEGLIYDGVISGTGTLVKTGTSGLRLTGNNTYSGGTIIESGRVGVASNSAFGTGTITFAGGYLRAHASGYTISNAAVLQDDGRIDTQAFTLTYAGSISGAGRLIKTGSGTLALAGANTYSGGTALNAGTVAISNNNALGTGTVTFNGGALQTAADGLTVANTASLASSGTIDTQNFQLTYSGVISGPGQLTKVGDGTLVLPGPNSYTGGTALNAGAVVVGGGTALGGGTVTFNGGLLRVGVDGIALANAAVLATNGTIDTQQFGFTYAGPISGPGQLTAIGTGKLTLTAANSYAGGTALNGGIVAVADSAALGTGTVTFNGGSLQAAADGLTLGNAAVLASNGTVDTQGFGLTMAGTISGAGQLAKSGDGTLTLTGVNTYTGGTVLSAGILAVGNSAALGTGGLTFGGGALQAAADGLTLNGAVTLARDGTIDTQNFGLTVSGTIAGSGELTKTGSGTLTLSAANTYTGGTALRAGTLAVGDNAALGTGTLSMDEDTTLAFTADNLTIANDIVFTGVRDPSIDTGPNFETLSGSISGSGALTKLGSGTLDLTGISTYTGGTTVAAGTLLVDGSIANSAVTVNNGATLGGGGTVGNLTLLGGSTLASAVGRTVTVVGNAVFASGSTYQVTINGDGSSSRLNAGGTITVNGATLTITAGTGTFGASTYTLLSAANGVTGEFATVNTPTSLALLSPSVTTAADAVTLTLSPVAFPTVAVTPNQAATAAAIQALGRTSPLYNAALTQTAAGARETFDSASGVVHADQAATVMATNRFLTTLILDRMWDVSGSGLSARQVLDQFAPDRLPALVRCYGPMPDPVPAAPTPTYTAWGSGFGSFGHNDRTANAGSLDRTLGGFVLGIDQAFDNVLGTQWRAGVAGGYTNTSFQSSLDAGNGTVQGVFGSLYGGARYGNVDVRVGTTVGGVFTDASRTVVAPGVFSETERSNNTGVTVQGFGEVGYRFVGATPTGGSASAVLEPVAGAAITHLHQDGFTERGGAAGLTVAARDYDLGTTSLGFRGEVAPIKDVPFVAHAYLAWQHTIGDVTPSSVLAFTANPTNSFTITGAPIDRDALAAEAAIDYRTSADMSIGLTYTGVIGPTAADHAVKGRMEYRF